MKRGLLFALPLAISLTGFAGVAFGETNFPQLVSGNGSERLCSLRPAKKCVDHIWKVVDRNGDDLLSPEEIDDFASHVRRWYESSDRELADLTTARIAHLSFNVVGAKRIVRSYDMDGDGMLNMAEATADMTDFETEERPLAALLLDPDAMDHEALADRFGIMGAKLVNLAQSVGSSLIGNGDVEVAGALADEARASDQLSEAN